METNRNIDDINTKFLILNYLQCWEPDFVAICTYRVVAIIEHQMKFERNIYEVILRDTIV